MGDERRGRLWQLLVVSLLFLLPFLALPTVMASRALEPAWERTGLSEGAIEDIALGPTGDGAATITYVAVRNQGIARRVGDGPWALVTEGLPRGVLGRVSPHRLVVDPSDSRRAFVALRNQTGGAVYATSNSGQTWQPILEGLPSHARALVMVGNHQLYVATVNSIIRSNDGGRTWRTLPHWPSETEVASLAVAPSAPNTFYLGGVGGEFFRSGDGGNTWERANAGLGNLTARAIAVDPLVPSHVYLGTSAGVYVTYNGGLAWQPTGFQLADAAVRRLLTDPRDGNTVYVGTDQLSVWISRNGGGQWLPLRAGTGSRRINALALEPQQRDLLLAGTEDALF
ncbi:MAG TPA: hypothetical protein DEP84_02435, partial [Chloroflexi bacterium]|nr:hypothetical protein [Chloroflexota bacterium]